MARISRLPRSAPLEELVKDTGELTRRLLETFRDLRAKRLTVSEARAQARVAEVILEAKRVEIVAARVGGGSFPAISFDTTAQTIDAEE
jgi:hypothetical protein